MEEEKRHIDTVQFELNKEDYFKPRERMRQVLCPSSCVIAADYRAVL